MFVTGVQTCALPICYARVPSPRSEWPQAGDPAQDQAELLLRLRGPDPSSKATLWVKAQHEGTWEVPSLVDHLPKGLKVPRQERVTL